MEYHDTNLNEVMVTHPEWKEDPQAHSREFYEEYQVTQEQHDEWYAWFIDKVMKSYDLGKKRAIKNTAIDYLNVSPMIKT